MASYKQNYLKEWIRLREQSKGFAVTEKEIQEKIKKTWPTLTKDEREKLFQQVQQ